jgi:hypothetical protein
MTLLVYNKEKNITKKCKICNNIYIPINSNQKYCIGCKPNIKNINWNKWYRSNKGYEPHIKINCIICNKEFIRKNIRQKYCRNKECKLAYLRLKRPINYAKNKKKIIEERRNDINYCIMNKLRMRISCAVKSQGTYKAKRTVELVGCSVIELKKYLENKFKDGMNWSNYSRIGWHIDHIQPCCSFDLTKEEEQTKCFHYTNLQPLWAKENLIKSDKWDGE